MSEQSLMISEEDRYYSDLLKDLAIRTVICLENPSDEEALIRQSYSIDALREFANLSPDESLADWIEKRVSNQKSVRIVIETGKASHTASSADCSVSFFTDTAKRRYLTKSQLRHYLQREHLDRSIRNEKWTLSEYALPEGTGIQIRASGDKKEPGSSKLYKYKSTQLYRVDSNADVITIEQPLGIHNSLLKGRLVLVKELEAEKDMAHDIINGDF